MPGSCFGISCTAAMMPYFICFMPEFCYGSTPLSGIYTYNYSYLLLYPQSSSTLCEPTTTAREWCTSTEKFVFCGGGGFHHGYTPTKRPSKKSETISSSTPINVKRKGWICLRWMFCGSLPFLYDEGGHPHNCASSFAKRYSSSMV